MQVVLLYSADRAIEAFVGVDLIAMIAMLS